MTNPRIAKLEDQIQQIVAQMLERRIKDPRLGFVTLTDVRLTGDGREATIFYTVLGDDKADSAAALESAKGLLRSTVGKTLGLKFAPSLAFVLDATEEGAKDMEDLLDRISRADAEAAERRSGAQYAGDADPYRRPDEPIAEGEAATDADLFIDGQPPAVVELPDEDA